MPDVLFLAYLPDPFGVGRSAFAIYTPEAGSKPIEPSELQSLARPVVTLDASALIEDLVRLNVGLPSTIIDIVEALRLRSGRSRKDGGERAWNPWKRLLAVAGDKPTVALFRDAFQAQEVLRADRTFEVLAVAGAALAGAWASVISDLTEDGEYERFFGLEVPIAQIFYQRQLSGIAIDQRKLKLLHAQAKREKYRAYIKVAEQTQVSPTGMTFRNVDQYLDRTDAAYLKFAAEFETVEDYFRMAADFSNFAREFVDYVRADRDLKVLSRLFGESRSHPRFHPHGTVTSRTLVSDPYLQQLRRKYRGIVAADKGYSLSYLDYRQFEPGILAGLSADPALKAAYNSRDLYLSLAVELFGEHVSAPARDLCKRMFLGFCYGMSEEHIAQVVSGPTATDEDRSRMLERVRAFFGKYDGLADFKRRTEEKLISDGYVETGLGNRRYRTSSGRLSGKERRWAISQVIQGNASLVFKEAIGALASKFGPSAIILPMHDAVLMQFEVGSVREKASQASEIMRTTFSARFPGIIPRVSVERFAVEDSAVVVTAPA